MGPAPSRPRITARRLEIAVPLLIYLVLVLSGATYSALGMDGLRQDPADPLGTTWGEPQSIRSDEYLTQTPQELNVLAHGHSTHSPLAQSGDLVAQTSSGQFFESVLFWDSTLLRLGPWLPDVQLFAAWRMLSFLLVALALPLLLRRMGASRPMSWLAVVLVVATPASLWWSFTPVRILGYASMGSLLVVLARDRWMHAGRRIDRIFAVVLACLGGLLLARLASYYVPWGITVGLPVVLATVAFLLLGRGPTRVAIGMLAVGGVFGGTLLLLTFWENSEAVRASLNTVYPGQRRTTGMQLPVFKLFGAPGLSVLANGQEPVGYNKSEVSSAYLLCAVWALALVGRLRPQRDPGRRAAIWVLGGFATLWLLWAAVNWGGLGLHLPLVNLVTPVRAAQTAGYPAMLMLCLTLSRVDLRPTLRTRDWWRRAWRVAWPAVAASAAVTAYGMSSLQAALPTITTTRVFVTSAAVGLLVLLVTWWRNWVSVVVVAAVLVSVGWWVNPVTFGLGDLRASGAAGKARNIGERAEAEGTWVAADDHYVSALLVSNGVPMLSGYQPSGPVAEEWELLDPDREFEEAWNRGASYLRFSFAGEPGTAPVVTAPVGDVIMVTIDPCGVPTELDLGRIASREQLDRDCLVPETTLQWQGSPVWVYRVTE